MMRIARLAALLFLMLAYCLRGVFEMVVARGRIARCLRMSRVTSTYSKRSLSLMGVSVSNSRPSGMDATGAVYFCNHLSWLDILIISATRPTLFVSSVELSESFGIGLLAKIGCAYFVERRNLAGLKQEIDDLRAIISGDVSVTVFPEATSSDGRDVLPFRSALFAAVFNIRTCIHPLCIRYSAIGDRAFDDRTRDLVCYYGTMSFIPHFIRLLSLPGISAELHELPPMAVSPGMSRKLLAVEAREAIRRCYHGAGPVQARQPVDASHAISAHGGTDMDATSPA